LKICRTFLKDFTVGKNLELAAEMEKGLVWVYRLHIGLYATIMDKLKFHHASRREQHSQYGCPWPKVLVLKHRNLWQ